MDTLLNNKTNKNKTIIHSFFLSIATSIAEPATILPLIVTYFGGNSVLVGFFAALLRGGAILVQMIAAFYAQSFSYVIIFIRRVFFARFLSWFCIGVCITLFGENHHTLTLFCLGAGLFLFSFSAGFGAIYFQEIFGKMFTHSYRGKVMAQRQFFGGLGSIISGTVAGWVLNHYEPPYSFGYLFIISSLLMGIGFISFGSIQESEKKNTLQKEKSFLLFLKNSFIILKNDSALKYQITTYLFSYSYLLALPFIILHVKESMGLDGTKIGLFISAQMLGAMLSNLAWSKLSQSGHNKAIVQLSTFFLIIIFITLNFIQTTTFYAIIFFFIGASMDGYRLGFTNLLLIIAPEDKRPIYVALQANISSIGIFFSILGGYILKFSSYNFLYTLSAAIILCNGILMFKLKDES